MTVHRRPSSRSRPWSRPWSRPSRRAAAATLAVSLAGTVVVTGFSDGPTAHAAGGEAAVPCAPTADACVSLARDQAWLVRDGHVSAGPVPTTHGTDAEPTPTGTFAVQWKDADHVSGEGAGGPMPWSVFFDTHGRALHGGSLTRNSVGCVHLSESDARTFFGALQPGDEVQILP